MCRVRRTGWEGEKSWHIFRFFLNWKKKLSRISEKQNETAREITQQAQDDKMAQKSGENPEKEAPEKLIDAVLTEVFS